MGSPEAGFDDLVQAIVADLCDPRRSTPCLDDVAFLGHARAIHNLKTERRRRIAVELVALTRRTIEVGEPTWDAAITQLCWLTGVALKDLAPAEQHLLRDLQNERARALIGEARKTRPVNAGASFESSLLGVQVTALKDKKT